MKRPSFQFYPGDWLNDAALRMCSVAARGLWIEMMCLMHQGEPYGHLKVNHKVVGAVALARIAGCGVSETENLLEELLHSGVTIKDSSGVFISKRMVKDEVLRMARAVGGRLGGNPDLGVNYNVPGFVYLMTRSDGWTKIGISQNPEKRASKLRSSTGDNSIKVSEKFWVMDMGKKESEIHAEFAHFEKSGEWFLLPDNEIANIISRHFTLNGNGTIKVKETPPPSSSSSSSSINTPLPPKGGEEAAEGKTKTKGPLQLRAEAIFNRRPATPLSAPEERALKGARAAIRATSEADWLVLEEFYRAPQTETFARKDLKTLLNNWTGEIDRARVWAKNKTGPSNDSTY